jgi:hypothetical protein
MNIITHKFIDDGNEVFIITMNWNDKTIRFDSSLTDSAMIFKVEELIVALNKFGYRIKQYGDHLTDKVLL